MWQRLKLFINPFDARYEDMRRDNWYLVAFRDFSAGLIVAMMAIPLAMGFAMASGLRPEQGIVGGAIAGLMGALFGGSKYQVYGPTAVFIPVIAGFMAMHVPVHGFDNTHGMLVLASAVAGVILALMGVAGLGKLANLVPHSIVVGFTIGIATTIATSQIGEVFGIHADLPKHFLGKLEVIGEHIGELNGNAVLLAIVTFLITNYLLKISIYIPAPLIALGIGALIPAALVNGDDLVLIRTKFGEIPTNFWVITPPVLPSLSIDLLGSIGYLAGVIVFVAGVESLLCSRMADRLADNRGTPFNPNKEFWGQGLVQIFTPLLNGFPHTGALARTATNIKLGAATPAVGIWKCFLKLAIAFYLAHYLELVPMACIAGILMWVAFNMVKPAEVRQVFAHSWFHVFLMIWTALAVILTDFMTGVVTGLVIYGLLFKFFDRPAPTPQVKEEMAPADSPAKSLAGQERQVGVA